MLRQSLLLCAFSTVLIGCGGSGDGNDNDDNGNGNAAPSLSIAPASAAEGDSGQTALDFQVSLSAAASAAVTADFATADASADASDYTALNGQITIPAGSTSTTISVEVLGDTTIETDEEFTVGLSNVANATLGTANAVGTIVNDDFPQLSIGDTQVTEGDNGTTAMTFAVTMDVPAIGDVTVDYVSSNGVATAGDDYTAVNTTLTIPEGDTNASITVDVLTDTLVEPDEQFVVNLLNPSPNVEILDDEGIGLIVNDDLARLAIGSANVTEPDAGNRTLSIPLTLSDPSPTDVTVDVTTSDGSAVAGQDYVAFTGPVTIPAGDTDASISVDVIGDAVAEGSEVFFVDIANVQGDAVIETAQSRPIILDNDGPPPGPQIFGLSTSATEGDSGTTPMTYLLFLDTVQASDVTVDYATANGTATEPDDYQATSGTVTFAAGATEASVTVLINGDTDDENNETVLLNLSNASGGIDLASATLTGTIGDDDQPPPPARLTIFNAAIEEPDTGTEDLVFNLTLDKAADTVVTVDFATEENTATADVDYVTTAGTVTFAVGETAQTLSVPVIGDTFTEDDERFRVRLSNLTGNAEFARVLASGFINTDEPFTTLSIANSQQSEGDSGTSELAFTVTLSNASAAQVTFDYQTADDTATAGVDYQAASGSVVIPIGDTEATIPVTIEGDTDNEPDERFTITLSNLSLNATFGNDTAAGAITNDDGSPGWQLPSLLGQGEDPRVDMDAAGNGAAVMVSRDDPLAPEMLTVTRFESGAWQAPEDAVDLDVFISPPRIRMLDNGRILLLYRNNVMETSLFTPGGSWVTEEIAPTFAFSYGLAANATGDAIAVWEQPGNNQDPTDILRNRYSQATGTWGGAEFVETDDTDNARAPGVLMDAAGNIMVVYSRPATGFWYTYYDAALATWTTPAVESGLQFASNISGTMLGDGRVAFAVRQRGFANDPESVEAWIYDPATDSWSISGPVETEAVEDAVIPTIVVDDDGNIFIAWLQQPQSGFFDAWVNRYDAATDQWGTPFNLEGGEGSLFGGISMDTDADGNVIAVWSQNLGANGDIHFRIRASRYTAADGLWSPPEQIDDGAITTGAFEASIAMDDAGNAIVVWHHPVFGDFGDVGEARYVAP